MLGYIKWAFWIVFWTLLIAVLHYTLPKRDIVFITGVEIKLEQFGENSIFWASPDLGTQADGQMVSRDVRFIDTVQRNGRVKVYRNEDTGAGWPPYFKFDSSNVQAEARNYVSTSAAPQWVAMRHYGWRIPWMTVFPNVVSIVPVAGPDVQLIPWFNIIFLTLLAAVFWAVWVRWRRFKAKRITPVIDGIDAGIDEKRAGISRWFASWRSKPRG